MGVYPQKTPLRAKGTRMPTDTRIFIYLHPQKLQAVCPSLPKCPILET